MLQSLINKLRGDQHRGKPDVDAILDVAMDVEGQVSREELRALVTLALEVPRATPIVEIGSYRGRSSVALGFGARLGNGPPVFAVDPHVEFVGVFGGRFGPKDQAELYRNLERTGLGEQVAVVSLPSVRAAAAWDERNIGLLWIDGDHSYDGVRTDYEAWRPFIAERGVIAFHDANSPEVARFLNEVRSELTPLGEIECLRWFAPA